MWGRGSRQHEGQGQSKMLASEIPLGTSAGEQRPCPETDWDLAGGLKHRLFVFFTGQRQQMYRVKQKKSLSVNLPQR